MFEINCSSVFTDILKETQGMLFSAHLHCIYCQQVQSIPRQAALWDRRRGRGWRWLPKQPKILRDYLSYSCSKGLASGSSAQRTGSITCFRKGFPPGTSSWVLSNVRPKLSHLDQLTECYLCLVRVIPFAGDISRKLLPRVVWPIYADVTTLNSIIRVNLSWRDHGNEPFVHKLLVDFSLKYDVSEKAQFVHCVSHRQL